MNMRLVAPIVASVAAASSWARPAVALEPPPPRPTPFAFAAGLEVGVLGSTQDQRTDFSGTNALTLELDWVEGHWGVSFGLGIPMPAPIAGTGVHVPVDVRYFPSGQGEGLFVHAGVRGMGTLATTCVSGGDCPEPEPGELPTTLGGLGGLGLGWQGAFGHGIGWRAHATYHAGYLLGGTLRGEGTDALSGFYQGGSVGFALRVGL